jgi:hypothetical protein
MAAHVRTQRNWEDNIKMDLRELSCEDGKYMEQAQKYFVIRSVIFKLLNYFGDAYPKDKL